MPTGNPDLFDTILAVEIVNSPPANMASRALIARLSIANSSCAGSVIANQASGAKTVLIAIVARWCAAASRQLGGQVIDVDRLGGDVIAARKTPAICCISLAPRSTEAIALAR